MGTCILTRMSKQFLLISAVLLMNGWSAEPPSDLIVIPVRVHLMQSMSNTRLQSTFSEHDVRAFWPEVNAIWQPARIRFEILTIRPLEALSPPPKRLFQRDRNWVKSAIPMEKLHADALDVCLVHEMGPNGFFYDEPVVVSETPDVFRVRHGARQPVARVTAHELGHVLTLQHRKPNSALLASGSTGVDLNDSEIQQARAAALRWLAHFQP
jgi:hypothetical protein